jgi:hypothetical protein
MCLTLSSRKLPGTAVGSVPASGKPRLTLHSSCFAPGGRHAGASHADCIAVVCVFIIDRYKVFVLSPGARFGLREGQQRHPAIQVAPTPFHDDVHFILSTL